MVLTARLRSAIRVLLGMMTQATPGAVMDDEPRALTAGGGHSVGHKHHGVLERLEGAEPN